MGFTFSHSAVGNRGTLSVQILPDVTATFRYSGIDLAIAAPRNLLFDRSFDLHWQVLDEGAVGGWSPAFAVGLRDIAGTGLYSSEYVVATRHFGADDRVAVSAGIGWGRLGERNGFTNPLGVIDDGFETRPPRNIGRGGTVNFNQVFRGDAAFFGGIEWQALGRVLRAMSAALPPSVEVFEVIFVVEGLDTTRIRISRSDLEQLEFDPDGARRGGTGAGAGRD